MADEVPQGAPPPPPPPPRPSELGDEEPLSTPSLAVGPMTMAEVETTAEAGEPEDRFRTWVAIAIAIVSILGAVVAFNATLTEQDARKLDAQGIEDASRQQQIVTDLQATVNQDLRYLVPYQEHIKAAQVLDQQANTLQATDSTSASLLHAQAESERVLARSWQSFFQAAFPTVGDATAPLTYDAGAALQRLENNDSDLQQLRPQALLDQADSTHRESVNLVGLVTLFVAALLFLTLAQFTRPAIRRIFAGAGGLVAVAGTVLWILVLRTGA
jgi:hypothetical protein